MKNKIIIITLIVLVIAGGVFINARVKNAAHNADQNQYKVAQVDLGEVKKTVSATGTLQPWSTVDIKSKAGGVVTALLVDVGSVVTKNQVLAKIDPSDTLLSFNTAKAQINGAKAHAAQAQATYQLQVQSSQIAVNNARAALASAMAARASSAAQLASAKSTAKAQPNLTKAAIAQAQASYNQAVKQREEMDSTNPQDQASAQAAYDQAVANQKAAKATLARQVDLVQKGFVAQQTVDTDQATYDVSAAQTNTAKKKLDTLAAQQQASIAAADAQVAQAAAALQNAKAQSVDIATKRASAQQAAASLQQADAQVDEAKVALTQAQANVANNQIKGYDIVYNDSQIASSQASFTNAETTLGQTIVRAPSEGVVLSKSISQGTIITSAVNTSSTGTDLLELGDLSRMYVQATVDETDLANVDAGQSVDVTFDAYPGIPFQGKVARVDPLAVVNSNVTQFNVRVEIDNSSPTFRLLKPGMNATCEFVVDDKNNVLSVPNEAVQTDDQGNSFVQAAAGGKPAPADPTTGMPADPGTLIGVKLTKVPVEVGVQGDDTTEITSGLKQGQTIVTETIAPVVATTPTTGSSPFAGGGGRPGGGGGGGGRR